MANRELTDGSIICRSKQEDQISSAEKQPFSPIRNQQARLTEFTIRSKINNPVIWDVTDQFNVTNIQYNRSGEDNKFRFGGDSLKTFAVFTPDKALTPVIKPVSHS